MKTLQGNEYDEQTGILNTKPFCWNCGGGKNGEEHLEDCDCKDGKFMMTIKVQTKPNPLEL